MHERIAVDRRRVLRAQLAGHERRAPASGRTARTRRCRSTRCGCPSGRRGPRSRVPRGRPTPRWPSARPGSWPRPRERSKSPRVTFGPWQPSCHSRPLASSIVAAVRSVSFWFGTVPGTKNSLTVLVVNGPGLSPVNASTVAVSMPCGGLNCAIFSPRLTSVRIADQSGADVSSESLPSLGRVVAVAHPDPDRRAPAPSCRPVGRRSRRPRRRGCRSWCRSCRRPAAGVLPSKIAHLPQNGLTFLSVLPARMSVMT